MADFFISYTSVDGAWAEWIGYVLEEEGFSVIIQAWDFRPGSNFVLEMQRAAANAARTVMVLSPEYLQSQFTSPEWATAFGQDPEGLSRKLIPVMARACQPTGLLTTIVQIRIVGLDERTARDTLLTGIREKRAKPAARPPFPGAPSPVEHKAFPGAKAEQPTTGAAGSQASGLIPSLSSNPTDIEKRRFVKYSFDAIRESLETNLKSVAREEKRIDTDFQPATATDFRAELFVDGKSKCVCRIWLGGMHSDDNICYSESRHTSGESCNEILSLSQAGRLEFQALLAMGMTEYEKSVDVKRLNADQAARYLWDRFVFPLRTLR